MKKIFFSFLFLMTGHAFGEECFIETKHKVYHLGAHDSNQPFAYLHSNCDEATNRAFMKTIINAKGFVQASTLAEMIAPQNQMSIKISPERIRVYDLPQILKDEYNHSSHWNFRQLNFLDRQPLLLNEDEQVDFSCSNCHHAGEKNITLNIRNIGNGTQMTRVLKSRVMIQTNALVAITAQRVSNQSITAGSFELKQIDSDRPEQFFTHEEKLGFYHLNRPLGEGEVLKFSDLTPATLVQPGTPATIILNTPQFELKTVAHPIRSARYGEMVQLRNPSTQKVITGKVIDFNKVEVIQ